MKKFLIAAFFTALCLFVGSCVEKKEITPENFFEKNKRYPVEIEIDGGSLRAKAVLELNENGSARLDFEEGFSKIFENGEEKDVMDGITFSLPGRSAFYALVSAAEKTASGQGYVRTEKEDGTLIFEWESDGECGRTKIILKKDAAFPLTVKTDRLEAKISAPE
ncbi:MAG: hypothetical protein IJV00_08345 [Clostridia bacterium]|nr:hypothetical protein [Clostridia bacterium]